MLAVADTARAELDIARRCFAQVNQFLQCLHRHLRIHQHQIAGQGSDLCHRREIGEHMKRQFFLRQLIDDKRIRRVEHGVPVGCGTRHQFAGNNAIGAAAIIDHQILAEHRLQKNRQRARVRIHAAAGRLRHHHTQRARGEVLAPGCARGSNTERQNPALHGDAHFFARMSCKPRIAIQ